MGPTLPQSAYPRFWIPMSVSRNGSGGMTLASLADSLDFRWTKPAQRIGPVL